MRSEWPPCTRHDGRHQSVSGQCVHWGAPAALRPGVCPEPGCAAPIMRRLDLGSGQVTLLEEGSDNAHTHQPPITVQLDEAALAEAIGAALAARLKPPPAPPPLILPPTRPESPAPGNGLGGIPRLP